jgi:hypothetical protein
MRSRRTFVGLVIIILLGIGVLAIRFKDSIFVPPPPLPEASVIRHDNPDGTIDLTVRMINRGGTTFSSRKDFWNLNSGLHLEVENAEILEFGAKSPLKDYEWYHYHVYPYIRLGNIQFLETRYDRLRKGEFGEARLKIKPTAEGPTVFYWRGWMTDIACMRDLIRSRIPGKAPPEYEPCVVRIPATNAPGSVRCPIDIATRKRTETNELGDYDLKELSCARLEI